MGTYYQIKYKGKADSRYQLAIEQTLREINSEVSSFIDSSVISLVNRSKDSFDLRRTTAYRKRKCRHFIENFRLADSIYKITGGAFDPTIMPLVNYWGFGYAERHKRTNPVAPDSLRELIGMDKIHLDGYVLYKSNPGVQLDFSAVAKGYAVDEIARVLEYFGLTDYLIDIGGELVAHGEKTKGKPWRVGINTPKEHGSLSDIALAVPLSNTAIATSGNYRNYYESNGRKYSHTINPTTGAPERNNLLSASILATRCALADALATSCMVKGMPEAYHFIQKTMGVEGCFIYSLPSGKDTLLMTKGFKHIRQNNSK